LGPTSATAPQPRAAAGSTSAPASPSSSSSKRPSMVAAFPVPRARSPAQAPSPARALSPPRHEDGPEFPPGIEPQGTIAYERAGEEPLLLEAVLTNLRSRDLRGLPDEGLALYLTPHRVYATRQDGTKVLAWDIADCAVEQSVRKALDRRYFNLVNREQDTKVHLYTTDQYVAARVKTIVEFYSDQRTRRTKLLNGLRLQKHHGRR